MVPDVLGGMHMRRFLLAAALLVLTTVAIRANVGPISGPWTGSNQFSITSGVVSIICGVTTDVGLTDCAQSWTATQTFASVLGSKGNAGSDISGTSYTLNSPGGIHSNNSDCGKLLVFTSSSPVTLTLDGTASVTCATSILQTGTGLITLANSAGSSFHSLLNGTQTAGQYAYMAVQAYENSDGSHAVFVLTGSYQ